ncbi:MAG TPA: helix-turn-helix transcriptional regulator [Planctomycetota bacterium]|nr:helix-turn-helix transcriptional regulator [Planctomycetota bacterium]
MNVGSRIRFYRQLRTLTQGQLASRVRMAPSQLSRYETGQTQPSLGVLGRLARALGVSVSDFFYGR